MKQTISGIILMAGIGKRFGREIPKQFARLAGKKVYQWCVETFLRSNLFDEILLVTHPNWLESVAQEMANIPVRVIPGGETRQASSLAGIQAARGDIVLLHDAVRPLVTQKIVEDNIASALAFGACDTCIPTTDTIVVGSSTIESIPERSSLFRGQTPQTFQKKLLLDAHLRTTKTEATDDCQLVHDTGHPVCIVQGDEKNIKITTELDLTIAEQLLKTASPLPLPTHSLSGKIFAVTGGHGAIGSAIIEALRQEGAIGVPLSRNTPLFSADLTKKKEAEAAFTKIQRRYGMLDGLITCAGLFMVAPLKTLSSEETTALIEANLLTTLLSYQSALLKKKAHILTLSSSSYSRGRRNYALYSACKAAIVNLTQAIAEEEPEKCINVLVPARVDSPMRSAYFPDEAKEDLLMPCEVARTAIEILKGTSTGTIYEVKPQNRTKDHFERSLISTARSSSGNTYT